MTIQSNQSTPPGWYPHPEGKPAVMWWDGANWDVNQQRWMGAIVGDTPATTVIVNQDPRKKVNHVLHFVLTILTFGMWLPVWLIVAIAKN